MNLRNTTFEMMQIQSRLFLDIIEYVRTGSFVYATQNWPKIGSDSLVRQG